MVRVKVRPVAAIFAALLPVTLGLTAGVPASTAAPTPSEARLPARSPLVKAVGPTVLEDVGTATLRVKVAKRARHAIRIGFHTLADSAHSGSDFIAKSGHVKIRKHHKSATIGVRIRDDSTQEGPERFFVKLASTEARFQHAKIAVRILDDDTSSTARLTGTITFHLQSDNYAADLELGTPGSKSWDSTFTMDVSLVRLGATDTWVDDGSGDWTFASTSQMWFRRGEGLDTEDNGFPFACADNPITFNFYKREYWYDAAGHNTGPLLTPPSAFAVPDLHQAFLTLDGYHPDGTGSPVLNVTAHIRPDHFETRIPDAAHVCDPDTVEHPNPIVHEGADDSYLDALESPSYQPRIPRDPDPGGLTATYDGSDLDFSDSDTVSTHAGFFNDQTGHWSTEETDAYTVSGTLHLS